VVRGPITGTRARIITWLVHASVVIIALRAYRSPRMARRSLQHIKQLNGTMRGGEHGQKYYRCGWRLSWTPTVPQWPSRPFVRFVETILDRVQPFRPDEVRLGGVVLAVSSRCPLACEHCLEGDNLGAREHLAIAELEQVLAKFRDLGVVQVFLSGGEPLMRCDDVCRLIAGAGPGIEFTLLTSGVGLTAAKARQLRRAGLRSVQIALDHWDEGRHDRFRGRVGAFAWARDAAFNAGQAGLLVGFALCAVRDFVSRENVWRYLELVRSWGGAYVRILEPHAVGRYAGRPVGLDPLQLSLLRAIHDEVNTDPAWAHLPRLSCPDHDRRTLGCFGAGNRLVYADSRAEVHPCPFCRGSVGNALTGDLAAMVAGMRRAGCGASRPAQGFPQTLAN
jgi:MoaA/NifB/PqqE/SkfB family radical SAM enzyme